MSNRSNASNQGNTRMERNRELREQTTAMMRRDAQRALGRGTTQGGRPRRIPRNQQLRLDI